MWIESVKKKTKSGSVSLRDIKLPAGKQRFQNISLRKKINTTFYFSIKF